MARSQITMAQRRRWCRQELEWRSELEDLKHTLNKTTTWIKAFDNDSRYYNYLVIFKYSQSEPANLKCSVNVAAIYSDVKYISK